MTVLAGSLLLLALFAVGGVVSQPCLPSNPAQCGGRNLTGENVTAAVNEEYG